MLKSNTGHSSKPIFTTIFSICFLLTSVVDSNSVLEFGAGNFDDIYNSSLVWKQCPNDSFVHGYSLRFNQDKSVLTAIRFYCTKQHVLNEKHHHGHGGHTKNEIHDVFDIELQSDSTGIWTKVLHCQHGGVVKGVQTKLIDNENQTGFASNLRMICSNGEILQYSKQVDDYWNDPFGNCETKQAVCGMQNPKMNSTDTAPKRIHIGCCDIPDRSLTCSPKVNWHKLSFCENPISTTPKTCIYSKNVGTSYAGQHKEVSKLYEDLGFHLTSVGSNLQHKMKQIINDSRIDEELNWVEESKTEEYDEITAQPGQKVSIFQLVGHCGFYKIKFNDFKTETELMHHQVHHKKVSHSHQHNKKKMAQKMKKWLMKHKQELEDEHHDDKEQGDQGWDSDEDDWGNDDWEESNENTKQIEKEPEVVESEKLKQVETKKEVGDDWESSWEDDVFDDSHEGQKPMSAEVKFVKSDADLSPQASTQAEQKEILNKDESEENDSWGDETFNSHEVENKVSADVVPHPPPPPQEQVKETPTKQESEENDSWGDDTVFDDSHEENKKTPDASEIKDSEHSHFNSVPVNKKQDSIDKEPLENDEWESVEEEIKPGKNEINPPSQSVVVAESNANVNHGEDVNNHHEFIVDVPLSQEEGNENSKSISTSNLKKPKHRSSAEEINVVEHVDVIGTPEHRHSANLKQAPSHHNNDHYSEQGDEEEDDWGDDVFDDDSWNMDTPEQSAPVNEHHHGTSDDHKDLKSEDVDIVEHDHHDHSVDHSKSKSMGQQQQQQHPVPDPTKILDSANELLEEGKKAMDDFKDIPIVKTIQDNIAENVKGTIFESPSSNDHENHDHQHETHNNEDSKKSANDNEATELSLDDSSASSQEENKLSNALLGYIVGGMVVAVCIIVIIIFVLEKRKPSPRSPNTNESDNLRKNEYNTHLEPPLLGEAASTKSDDKRITIEEEN